MASKRTIGLLSAAVAAFVAAVAIGDYGLGAYHQYKRTHSLACNPEHLPAQATDDRHPADERRVQFSRQIVDPTTGRQHRPKAIADMTGDGFPDVIAHTTGEGLFLYTYPYWKKSKIQDGGQGELAQAVDVDNDRDVDLVIGGHGVRTRWFENPSGSADSGEWREHPLHALVDNHGTLQSHDTVVADVDGDGRIDVANEAGIALQAAPGRWTFLENSHFPMRGWHGTAFGDMRNDHHPDLLDLSGGKVVWYENPLSSGEPITSVWRRHVVTDAFPPGPEGFAAVSIAADDIDGDGRQDVLIANNKGGGGLSWLQQPGDPATQQWDRHLIDASVNWVHHSSILTGDIDLNGTIDVIVAEQEQSPTHRVIVYYNEGSNSWVRQIVSSAGGHNPKLGDIDADGDLDLLNANHGYCGAENPIELWINSTSRPAIVQSEDPGA
jgi:hypothetical protein